MTGEKQPASFGRILLTLLPLAVIAYVGAQYMNASVQETAQRQLEADMLERLLGNTLAGPKDAVRFQDADGDLLADPPADDACVKPTELVFSYIAGEGSDDSEEAWTDLVKALGEAVDAPATYKKYDSLDDQLAALAKGELHVCGIGAGATPTAAERAGFVPVCTFGNDAGEFGYTMRVLTPAKSGIQGLDGLKGHRLTFTQPDSNSGCKAALVLLLNEHQLYPERDYDWTFSMGHEESIRGVAKGEFEAAPVASDVLERMVAQGEVSEGDIRVVYESERFPPATLGYAYHLPPAWREAIRTALLGFDWSGTGVEKEYALDGVTRFVPVNYKDDWANIRRVDDAVRAARTAKP